jgi:hypothetical protein
MSNNGGDTNCLAVSRDSFPQAKCNPRREAPKDPRPALTRAVVALTSVSMDGLTRPHTHTATRLQVTGLEHEGASWLETRSEGLGLTLHERLRQVIDDQPVLLGSQPTPAPHHAGRQV